MMYHCVSHPFHWELVVIDGKLVILVYISILIFIFRIFELDCLMGFTLEVMGIGFIASEDSKIYWV